MRICVREAESNDLPPRFSSRQERNKNINDLLSRGFTKIETADQLGISYSIVTRNATPGLARRATPVPSRRLILNRPPIDQWSLAPVADDPITDAGKLLVDCDARDCRWPIGKDKSGAFRFCAKRKQRGAYCAAHASESVPR